MALSNKHLSRLLQQFLLILPWLLLPLLTYVAGQFLEGPPFRVIVRSVPFIVATLGLAGLAALHLHRRFAAPLWLCLTLGAAVPAGFIFALQGYYHGGQNSAFAMLAGSFTALMAINLTVYLLSLSGRTGSGGKSNEHMQKNSSHYTIELFQLDDDGEPGRVVFEEKAKDQHPQGIIVDGFSQDRYIDLQPHWQEISQRQLCSYQAPITTYETIIKFGDTVQLINHYQLVITLS